MAERITTIKLSKTTKERLEHVRLYPRESYDEMVRRILDILNICRTSPERARAHLIAMERQTRRQNAHRGKEPKHETRNVPAKKVPGADRAILHLKERDH